MHRVLGSILIIFHCIGSSAQTTEVKYYNSKYEEVSQKKAKYVSTITKNNDGSETMAETNLRTGYLRSETYKDHEPYGIWKSGANELDYNFKLVYSKEECSNTGLVLKQKKYFEDDESAAYKAPRISREVDFFQYLGNNIRYPGPAKENGIQGKVYAQFTITKDGSVKDISITKGVHMVLDKEYVRVIRKMKFNIPPMVNGQPVEICVSAPATFRLE